MLNKATLISPSSFNCYTSYNTKIFIGYYSSLKFPKRALETLRLFRHHQKPTN